MKIHYDQIADVLFIQLSDRPGISTQSLHNGGTFLHLDENDDLSAIELIGARARGFDPLSFSMDYFTADHKAKSLSPAEVDAYRQARNGAAARKRERHETR